MDFRIRSYAILIGGLVTMASCEKTETVYQQYQVPANYTFTDVSFTEATQAINMWQGFQGYLGRGSSRQLSQDTVNNLWNNTNNPFTAENVSNLPNTPDQLNVSTAVKLSALTKDPSVIKVYADSMVKISQYFATPGSKGVAGKQSSRIFNYSGLEFNQAVAKGLMGSFAMNQIFDHLDRAATADNKLIIPMKGTARQHEWDLAFGYVGIPVDYDTSKSYTAAPLNTSLTRPLAIGGYFAERGKFIKAGGIVFEAFRKGRAAIGANDAKGQADAAATIKEFVEKTLAAAFYNYVTTPQSTSASLDGRLHGLSEGYGFMVALKYRPTTSKLSTANYQTLVDIMNTNFYTLLDETAVSPALTKLQTAQKILKDTYGQLIP